MEKEKQPCSGALIERGVIVEAGENDFLVESLDRVGILARIPAIGSAADAELAEEDRVYFFLFPDGTGAIIGQLEV